MAQALIGKCANISKSGLGEKLQRRNLIKCRAKRTRFEYDSVEQSRRGVAGSARASSPPGEGALLYFMESNVLDTYELRL